MIHEVEYSGGPSRYSFGNDGVDYMLCVVTDKNGDEVELYAEESADEDDVNVNYEYLKNEIIDQAAEHGIHRNELKFWYD